MLENTIISPVTVVGTQVLQYFQSSLKITSKRRVGSSIFASAFLFISKELLARIIQCHRNRFRAYTFICILTSAQFIFIASVIPILEAARGSMSKTMCRPVFFLKIDIKNPEA